MVHCWCYWQNSWKTSINYCHPHPWEKSGYLYSQCGHGGICDCGMYFACLSVFFFFMMVVRNIDYIIDTYDRQGFDSHISWFFVLNFVFFYLLVWAYHWDGSWGWKMWCLLYWLAIDFYLLASLTMHIHLNSMLHISNAFLVYEWLFIACSWISLY